MSTMTSSAEREGKVTLDELRQKAKTLTSPTSKDSDYLIALKAREEFAEAYFDFCVGLVRDRGHTTSVDLSYVGVPSGMHDSMHKAIFECAVQRFVKETGNKNQEIVTDLLGVTKKRSDDVVGA